MIQICLGMYRENIPFTDIDHKSMHLNIEQNSGAAVGKSGCLVLEGSCSKGFVFKSQPQQT